MAGRERPIYPSKAATRHHKSKHTTSHDVQPLSDLLFDSNYSTHLFLLFFVTTVLFTLVFSRLDIVLASHNLPSTLLIPRALVPPPSTCPPPSSFVHTEVAGVASASTNSTISPNHNPPGAKVIWSEGMNTQIATEMLNELKTWRILKHYDGYIWSHDPYFNRAEGDEAQMFVMHQLPLNCSRDPNRLVVDVGALYGDFSAASGLLGCYTHSFEPLAPFALLTSMQAALNGVGELVTVWQAVVSNQPSVTFLTQGGKSMYSDSSSVPVQCNSMCPDGNRTLRGVSLDETIGNRTAVMIKIDVEGFEPILLETAARALREHRVHFVIAEYTPRFRDRGHDWSQFLPRLVQLGATHLFTLARSQPSAQQIPTDAATLARFYERHVSLQTDILAAFHNRVPASFLAKTTTWG